MNKTFDCVEMKHRGAEKIRKKITKLSADEELRFWQEMTASLKKRKEQIIEKNRIKA